MQYRKRNTNVQREQHQNMYIIKCESDHQSRLDAWDKCLGLVHWDDPEGLDGGSGGGTYVIPWLIHVNVWQKSLQYYKLISLQLIKINGKKKHECKGKRIISHNRNFKEQSFLLLFSLSLFLSLFFLFCLFVCFNTFPEKIWRNILEM